MDTTDTTCPFSAIASAREAAISSLRGRTSVEDAREVAHEASDVIYAAFDRTDSRLDEQELQGLRSELADIFAALNYSTWGGAHWAREAHTLLGLDPIH